MQVQGGVIMEEEKVIKKFKTEVLAYYSCDGNFQRMGKEKLKEEYSKDEHHFSETISFEKLKKIADENNINLTVLKKIFHYGGWEYDDREGKPIPGTYSREYSERKSVIKLTYRILPINHAEGFDERVSKFYYTNNILYETLKKDTKSKETLQQIRQMLIECSNDTYISEQLKLVEEYLLYESEKFFKENLEDLIEESLNDITNPKPSIMISVFRAFPYYEYSAEARIKSIEKLLSDVCLRKFAGLNVYPETNLLDDLPNQDDIFFIYASRVGYSGYGLIRLSTLISLAAENGIDITTPESMSEAIDDYKSNRGISFSREKCEPFLLNMSAQLNLANESKLQIKT